VNVRLALVGAVQSTERALQTLARMANLPLLVLTLPPEKSARHSDYVDLHPLAGTLGVPVIDVTDVNNPEVRERLSGLELDVIMVIGWSRICGPEFVAIPRLGTLGFHPTLLPSMRGRAALAWTILLGLRETGATFFWIDEGVDSGPIAAQRRIPLTGSEALRELMDRQLDALEWMLSDLLKQFSRGERPALQQDESRATFLALRRAEDGEIDWSQPAPAIERLIRAVSKPYPGAFTHLGRRKLTIWSARVASYPEWFALLGQVFVVDRDGPVVRCGDGNALVLLEFDLEELVGGAKPPSAFAGQPRLGRDR
jgi:methionyl-tRNA formyltransferase